MARKQSILAPDWWDFTTVDDGILNDAAKLTAEDMMSLSHQCHELIGTGAGPATEYLVKR